MAQVTFRWTPTRQMYQLWCLTYRNWCYADTPMGAGVVVPTAMDAFEDPPDVLLGHPIQTHRTGHGAYSQDAPSVPLQDHRPGQGAHIQGSP